VRRAAFVAFAFALAVVAAGCARERPSALAIRNCLRDHGAEQVRLTRLGEAPPGVHDDWSGVQIVTALHEVTAPAPAGPAYAGETVVVAPSDAEARRIAATFRNFGAPVDPRGSLLVLGEPRLLDRCL
jgi:hypothetical protein